MVVIEEIKAKLQMDIAAANTASRTKTNVDEAMNEYNEKMALAVANAFEMFMNTATIVGTCPPNGGPLAAGKIE